MAVLVPPEVNGNTTKKTAAAEDEPAGGCGSQNGRSSGGEMAAMEKKLAENNDVVASRETEIQLPATTKATKAKSKKNPDKSRTPKQVKAQFMGKCERCGYISSQKVCKACSLLEGLNKNRPKTAIEVGVGMEDEESSSTLMRQMEHVQLTSG